MGAFIKVPIMTRMKKDYRECRERLKKGMEKECDCCSVNGGIMFRCLAELPWGIEGEGESVWMESTEK